MLWKMPPTTKRQIVPIPSGIAALMKKQRMLTQSHRTISRFLLRRSASRPPTRLAGSMMTLEPTK